MILSISVAVEHDVDVAQKVRCLRQPRVTAECHPLDAASRGLQPEVEVLETLGLELIRIRHQCVSCLEGGHCPTAPDAPSCALDVQESFTPLKCFVTLIGTDAMFCSVRVFIADHLKLMAIGGGILFVPTPQFWTVRCAIELPCFLVTFVINTQVLSHTSTESPMLIKRFFADGAGHCRRRSK